MTLDQKEGKEEKKLEKKSISDLKPSHTTTQKETLGVWIETLRRTSWSLQRVVARVEEGVVGGERVAKHV